MMLNISDCGEIVKNIFSFTKEGNLSQKDITAFVTDYYSKLLDFALNFCCGDRALAEDIIQDSYITAMEKISFIKNKESLYPWFVSIMKNKVIDVFRYNSSEISVEDVSAITSSFEARFTISPENQIIKDEGFPPTVETLRKFTAMLPIDDIEIITAVCFQNMTYDEAAEFLKIPNSTLRRKYVSAKERLADIMNDYYEKNGGLL